MIKKRNSDYQKVCLFCENATVLIGDDNLLCKYKGIVSEDFICRKYIYDPLKRQPVSMPKLQPVSKDDLI